MGKEQKFIYRLKMNNGFDKLNGVDANGNLNRKDNSTKNLDKRKDEQPVKDGLTPSSSVHVKPNSVDDLTKSPKVIEIPDDGGNTKMSEGASTPVSMGLNV